MTPRLPSGISWSQDGVLSEDIAEIEKRRPLSMYVHIPFCRIRCGYCDFNTYTVGFGAGAQIGDYASSVLSELDFAQRALLASGFSKRPLSTLFLGGGTPTMLATRELHEIIEGIRSRFGFIPGVEITCEANPETIDSDIVKELAKAGVTRLSIGMQSAVPKVLSVLDRQHRPERVYEAVTWAREAGIDVSVDLIYGTPGESLRDWEESLESAIRMKPDHISAYALIIEEGTKMYGQVHRGELPVPDPDDEAAKYELADQLLSAADYRWYEISNFARVEDNEKNTISTQLKHASRHNLAYWRDWDWWGIGPGAHSHLGKARWWNVKHPLAYAQRTRDGVSPAQEGEILDPTTRLLEKILLGIRTAEGIPISLVAAASRDCVIEMINDGLIARDAYDEGRIILTLRGRLLADYVTRKLTD